MLNNNHQNSSCTYAEQIVSYLYDEASVKEKTEFVAHLENCSGCREELDAFGFVRSSIREWKTEEIYAFEMPAIEIPHWEQTKIVESTVNPAHSESWTDRLRGLFSVSPKLAFGSAAFALLAVCSGLGLFIFNFSNGSELAENVNSTGQNQLAANANKIQEEIVSKPPADAPKPELIPSKNKPEQAQISFPKDSAEKPSVNIKEASKNKISSKKPNNTLAENNIENRKNPVNKIQKQETPKLSDLKEEEDNSLRLTDLFAEIGTE